ncbi:hypothetical protein C8J57DRAFT_1416154 [Mycena rebaudengoi]|nr:hypothetical protein C8J57DRAFT_1416154 [Mycena rebaudengoi]
MSSIAAQKSALKFAVVGASNDPSKFGAKVGFADLQTNCALTNHPNKTEVQGIPCLKSLSDLPDPKNTCLHRCASIGTPATISVLEQAKSAGVFALWLQPGAEDADCVQYIRDNGLEAVSIYSKVVAVHDLKAAAEEIPDVKLCLILDTRKIAGLV